MNDTPRVDAVAIFIVTRNELFDEMEMCPANFARQLERELNQAKNALQLLHDETADYIRINRLGKVHHNETMKRAALVLGIPLEE